MAGIKFDFTGDNRNLLNSAKQAQTGVVNAINSIEKAGRGIENTFSSIKNSVLGGFTDIAKGMAGLTALMQGGNFIKELIADAGKFKVAMKEVSTLSEDVATNLQKYIDQVVDMTTQIPIGATESAKALYQIESAGHHGADGLNVLRESAKGAIGGVTDTATTADAITTILNAYNMEASQAQHVSDLLFTTVRLGKTNMSQLGTTIAQVAPVAASFGVSIEDVLAAIASLTKQGTKTSVAVRQVRDAITATTKSMGDGAFQGRSFLDAMDEVAQKAQGSNNALRQDLGTLQALNAVLALTGKNSQAARQDVADMQNSAGAAEAAYQKMASTAGTQVTLLRNNIFKAILPLADEMRAMSGDIARYMNEAFDSGAMDKALVSLEAFIAAYATYRGMLAASTAWNSAALGGTYQVQIAELQKLIPLKELDGQADLQAAVAKGTLTTEQAKLVASLRAETKARYEEVMAAETEARANLKALTAAEASATANVTAAEEMVASAQARLVAATQSGVATEIETAKEELNTAEMLRNDAVRKKTIITRQMEGAQTMVSVTSKNAETAATLMNTTQQGVNATATGILATAKLHLAAAIDAVNASFLASPLFWIAAAIAGVTFAVYKLVTAETANEEAIRKANEAMDEQKKKLDDRKSSIEGFIRTIQDPNATDFQKIKAYDALKQVASDITDAYSREALAAMEVANAQKMVNESMEESDYEETKRKVEELTEKLANFNKDLQESLKNSGSGYGAAAISRAAYREKAVWEEELKRQKQHLEEIGDIRKRVDEENTPIEIRIEAAKENEEEQKRIFDFYDAVMSRVDDIQDSHNKLNFDEAKSKLDDYISEVEAELADLHTQAEQNPIDKKIRLKEEEKTNLLNRLTQWKRDMAAGGFTTIPLMFKADWGSAKAALNAAIGIFQNLLNQTTIGGTQSMADLYKAAKTDYENALKEWKRVSDKKNASFITQEEYNKAKTNLATAKSSFEAVGGDPDGKLAKESQKKAAELAKETADRQAKEKQQAQKHTEEMVKLERDAARALEDAKIAGIKSAAERERAEREEQHKRTIEDIKRQEENIYKKIYQDRKTAYENANKGKQNVTPFELTPQGDPKAWQEFIDYATTGIKAIQDSMDSLDPSKLDAVFTEIDNLDLSKFNEDNGEVDLIRENLKKMVSEVAQKNAEYTRSEEERLKQLTAAHQSYTDKKIALDKKYKEDIEAINAEIARAEARGDKEAAEELKRTRIEAIKDYAKEQSALSLEQLKETPDYIRAFEDLENTSTETLEHLIKEFEKVKSSAATNLAPTELREITKTIEQMKDTLNSRNPFKQLSASLKELNAATNKLDWSKLQLLQAEADLKAVQNGEKVAAGIGYDRKTNQTYTIYLDEEEALKRVEKATDGVREANDEMHNSQNKVNKAVTQSISEYRDLGNAVGDLGSQFDGLAGKIMSATGEVISFATDGADAIAKVSAGIKEGMSALESASLILTAISAGMKIMNTISSLFGGDDEAEERKYQALLERLDKRLEVTNQRISELNDTLENSYGGEAEKVAEEMRNTLLTAMGQLKDSILTQRREDGVWSSGFVPSNHIIFDLINNYDLNSSGNWFTASKELFEENNIEDVAKALADFRKKNQVIWADLISYCGEYGDEIEALADKWEEFDKTFDKERERILGTNIDTLTSDMLSSLYDLADGAEDVTESVADNFEKMMNRMVINAVIAEELRKKLTEYINAWKEAYDSGGIDDTERENLRNMYNGIYEEYAKRIDELRYDGLIRGTNDSATKYFSGLRDSFISTLTNMEDDAESWKNDILRIMFEDLVNKNVVNRQLWVNQGKDQFGEDIIMQYANLEEYLDHWTERYNAVLNNQYIGEQERAAKLKELMDELTGVREEAEKAAEEIADGIGYSKEISNALDNLKESFVDALLDMDMDAEKFGRQIGQTLIKEMLQEMLASGAYADQMKAIKELWQKVLDSDNGRYWDEEGKYGEAGVSYTLEDIQAMVTELIETVSQDKSISKWVDQWKELEKVADDTFSGMTDSFVSALMDMDGDIEDFANNMKKTIVQKLVEAFLVSEKIKPILDGLQKTFNDVMADASLSPEERAAKIGAAIHAALPAETLQGLQDTVKHLLENIGYQFKEVETLFSSLGDTILSSLMNTENGVEDFMDSITNTIVEDLVKSYMATKEFQDGLKTVKDDLEAAVKDLAEAKTPEAIAEAEAQLEKAKQAAEDFYNEAVDGTKRFTDALKKIENDTTFKDMTGNWVSNLMDFNATAEDWAEEIGQTMAQKIIEQMIVPTMIQPLLDNIQKAFNDAMATNTTTDAEGNAVYNWKGVLNDEGLKASITALQDAYPELKDVVQQILSLSGVKPDFSNSLDSLGDTLLDRLLSLDDDVEDIGKQIGQTLIREMLEQMLSTGQYADRIAAIKKMWQAILTGEDTEHTIEDVLKDIELLENDITNPENSDFSSLIAKYKSLADVAKEGFSDLRGAFLSSLIDMNGDAETFGKSIGRTMLEQMLDAYVERTYKEQIAAINKEWAEALQSGNTDALERIKQKVQELYSTISTDVEVSNIADAIKELDKQLDTTFSDMADSWTSTLMDMEATAEDWAQSVGKMIAEKIIKSMVIPTMIQPILDTMQKAWNAAAEQEGATYQTMLDAMMPYVGQLVGAYEELRPIADYILNSLGVYKETLEEVAEEVEYHLQDMKSNFASTLMDMKGTAEDWSRSISEILAEAFIKDIVLGDAFDAQMKDWQAHYESILNSGLSEEDRLKQMKLLRDAIVSAKEGYVEQAMAIQELLGLNVASSNQTATANIADKATYEQEDKLIGINMAQEMTLEQILYTLRGGIGVTGVGLGLASSSNSETARQIESTLNSMGGLTSSDSETIREIRGLIIIGNSYLYDIKTSNEQMLRQFGERLESIDGKIGQIF